VNAPGIFDSGAIACSNIRGHPAEGEYWGKVVPDA